MANVTCFVSHQDFSDVIDDADYAIWRDQNFELLVRFNLFPETKEYGLSTNFFFTSFAVNSVRYGKHGFPFVDAPSTVSFLKPNRIAQLKSLPDGIDGKILESRIFSFSGIKLLVTENDFRGLLTYFDFKIFLGEFYEPISPQGILGQTFLPDYHWMPNHYWRVS